MKYRVRRWLIGGTLSIVGVGLCTSFASSAWAAPVSSSDDSLADRYFFEAKARAAEQNWEEAYKLFEKAWELKPSHDIAGNLGQVALKLGRYRKAATFLERCLRLFPPTGKAEQREQIQALSASARRHVAAIRLHVVPQPGELLLDRVTVLGAVSEPAEPVFVDPGTHVVQIRRDGRILADQTFVAVENTVQDITLAQSDSNASLSGPPPPQAPRVESRGAGSSELPAATPGQRSKIPIVIGATIAVGGFVSAAILVNAANNEVANANRISSGHEKDLCSNSPNTPVCENLRDANVRADTRYNWGHAMLGIGAAAVLATGTYIFWPVAEPKEKDHSGRDGRLLLGYGASQATISWMGRF